MSENPSALLRLWEEFSAAEPKAVFGGIYAAKGGYHNTRYNHQHGIHGGKPGDYSVQTGADLRGPADKAAALDLTFSDAQKSDFRTIAKYTTRLISAMKARDERLFYRGKMVVRECFGNSDTDRAVEGWSLYRGYAVSSDPSHQWHLHISFFREFVENWDAVKGTLEVLLGQPVDKPAPPAQDNDEDDMPTAQEIAQAVWSLSMDPRATADRIGAPELSTTQKIRMDDALVEVRARIADTDAAQDDQYADLQRKLSAVRDDQAKLENAVQGLYAKFDSLIAELRKANGETPPAA
jgi:hypothetical protein